MRMHNILRRKKQIPNSSSRTGSGRIRQRVGIINLAISKSDTTGKQYLSEPTADIIRRPRGVHRQEHYPNHDTHKQKKQPADFGQKLDYNAGEQDSCHTDALGEPLRLYPTINLVLSKSGRIGPQIKENQRTSYVFK